MISSNTLACKDQNPWHSNDTPESFDCSEHHWINGSVISVSLTLTLGLKYEWPNNMGISTKLKALGSQGNSKKQEPIKEKGTF